MSLTGDQKKHLLIGGGCGALAVVAGYYLLKGRAAHADILPVSRHRGHHHHGVLDQETLGEGENDRGEYGHKKHHHHHHGGYEHER